MSTVYYTKCCDFMFIGKNHSPEYEGKCRHCGAIWEGYVDYKVLEDK